MIKLQDFAKQHGVTDRAIQKHLKKYEAELEGLYERKGPNGTWLSDEACEILRSKMKQQPVVVMDEDHRVIELTERVRELEKMLSIAQQQVQEAQNKVGELQETAAKVALLESDNEAAKQRAEQAEEARCRAERQAVELQAELDRKTEAEKSLAQRVVSAEERAVSAEQTVEELEAENAEMKNAGFFKRLFGWKK